MVSEHSVSQDINIILYNKAQPKLVSFAHSKKARPPSKIAHSQFETPSLLFMKLANKPEDAFAEQRDTKWMLRRVHKDLF